MLTLIEPATGSVLEPNVHPLQSDVVISGSPPASAVATGIGVCVLAQYLNALPPESGRSIPSRPAFQSFSMSSSACEPATAFAHAAYAASAMCSALVVAHQGISGRNNAPTTRATKLSRKSSDLLFFSAIATISLNFMSLPLLSYFDKCAQLKPLQSDLIFMFA